MSQSKYWCFTINNYDQDDYEKTVETLTNAQYGILGKEGKSCTPHLQGYVVFHSRKRKSQVRKLIPGHVERAKGTPGQNKAYCSKEGDYEQFGVCPGGQGTRTDLQQILTDIKEGKNPMEIREKHWASYLRYSKAIESTILFYSVPRRWETQVNVYWGETGLGKTRRAYEEAGDQVYFHTGSQWFDGYVGGDAIFDDFGGSEFKLTYLLKLLDRYPMRVPVKGGFVQWTPRRIWITSNRSPDDWYPNAHSEHVAALRRRFSTVVHFSNPLGINQ